jgi:mannose-6-phosphate isomerase-like protein (cupin superfamily)
LISRIERGQRIPSIATLYAIAVELGLKLDDIFKSVRPAVSNRAGRPRKLQRTERGNSIRLAGGVKWERLWSEYNKDWEFRFVVYAPGVESCSPGDTVQRGGREFAYVIRGRLGITIAEEWFALGAGDSILFDANIPHRVRVIGRESAEAVWLALNNDTRRRPGARIKCLARGTQEPTRSKIVE